VEDYSYFLDGEVVCAKCQTPNTKKYERVFTIFYTAMKREFESDETFDVAKWKKNFPAMLRELHAERKTKVECLKHELTSLPADLSNIVVGYLFAERHLDH